MLQLCVTHSCRPRNHLTTVEHSHCLRELQAFLPAVNKICYTATSQAMAQAKPSQSQPLWLGLRILKAKATQSQAKATGFQAKPSQNITTSHQSV
jgi:hypothetical protein